MGLSITHKPLYIFCFHDFVENVYEKMSGKSDFLPNLYVIKHSLHKAIKRYFTCSP
jgi:hypothetical protein